MTLTADKAPPHSPRASTDHGQRRGRTDLDHRGGLRLAGTTRRRASHRDVPTSSPASTAPGQHPGARTFVGEANGRRPTPTATPCLLPRCRRSRYGPGQIFTATVDYGVSNTSVFSAPRRPRARPADAATAIPGETIAPGQQFTCAEPSGERPCRPAGWPTVRGWTSLAYHLTSTLGLYESGGSFHTNLLGGGEQRWVQGSGEGWYYILPSGALRLERLRAWNGTLMLRELDPELQRQPQPAGQRQARPGAGDCKHLRLVFDDQAKRRASYRCASFVTCDCQRRLQHGTAKRSSSPWPHPPCLRSGDCAPSSKSRIRRRKGTGSARTGRRDTTCSTAAPACRPATSSPSPKRDELIPGRRELHLETLVHCRPPGAAAASAASLLLRLEASPCAVNLGATTNRLEAQACCICSIGTIKGGARGADQRRRSSALVLAKPRVGVDVDSRGDLPGPSRSTAIMLITITSQGAANAVPQRTVPQCTGCSRCPPRRPPAFVKSDPRRRRGAGWARTRRRATTCSTAAPACPAGDTVTIAGQASSLYLDDELHRPFVHCRPPRGRWPHRRRLVLRLERFTVAVNLSDNQSHGLELYLLDWDNKGARARVQISDAKTGRCVLAAASALLVPAGTYLDFTASGNGLISDHQPRCGQCAVLNGVFADPVVTHESSGHGWRGHGSRGWWAAKLDRSFLRRLHGSRSQQFNFQPAPRRAARRHQARSRSAFD